MRAPRTLAARLVLTAVALVAVVSLLIAAVVTVAVRHQQLEQLDRDVVSSLGRIGDGDADNTGGAPSDGDHDNTGSNGSFRHGPPPRGSNLAPGTIFASTLGDGADDRGLLLTQEMYGARELSSTVLRQLRGVPADGQVHSVELTGLGHYRVAGSKRPDGRTLYSGLPTRDVDSTMATLVGYEVLLIALGLVAAAAIGSLLVRRQLAPLRKVAGTAHRVSDLPLSTGAIDLHERVPPQLTDERTEVGQVGAALNTLLNHVESSLEYRHRSEQQVRQFVADASHELRTPLSTIRGYAELSRRTPDDPAALSHAMTKVETETDRMASLVEDLLLLARLDSGRPLERAEVDVTRLLLESVADARVVDPDRRWQLHLPDEPVSVTGDEQRLHQIVSNLLSNARHHTPPGTTVTVSTSTSTEGAVVEVHDDGPGLPPGLADHAVERFTRGDSSRTRASGGAGLGLSLVAAIAQAHGGRASVESRPGSTTFRILLAA